MLTVQDIPLYDPYVYKFISKGETKGIFQIESPGMQGLMKRMYFDVAKRISELEDKYLCRGFESVCTKTEYFGKETDTEKITNIKEDFLTEMKVLGKEMFERMIAAISLYRPGPMDSIDDYIEGMTNPDKIKYDCPELESILANTYGIIVYQEQVQQIVRKLAGYSLGRGDLIRRAMGKKKTAIMNAEQPIFLYGNEGKLKEGEAVVPGCINNGIDEDVAIKIWDKMKKFAEYAFNKSHSAGYAVITIQTAWMKHYFPLDFIVATLNSVISKSDKLKVYIAEATAMGFKILSPDVNKSSLLYTIEGDEIRTGLMALRNMGKMAIPIVEEREANGNFSDIYDFIDRMLSDIDKKVIEALTFAGALDGFGYTRRTLISNVDDIVAYIKHIKRGLFEEVPFTLPLVEKAYSILGRIKIEQIEEFEPAYLLEKENEFTGMYISGHPLDLYQEYLKFNKVLDINEIVLEADEETGERPDSPYDGKEVKIAGIIRNYKQMVTKNGDNMSMFEIEDKTSDIKVVCFPKSLKAILSSGILLDDNLIVIATGKVQDNDRGCQVIINNVQEIKSMDFDEGEMVYVDCRKETTVSEALKELIDNNPGDVPISVKFASGWQQSTKNINLDWTFYVKLKGLYPFEIKPFKRGKK